MSNKRTFFYSSLGIVLVLVILVSLNLIGSIAYTRVDITQDQLYTVSNGTKAILAKLPTQITIRYYYSHEVAEMPVELKNYATRVRDLLREYELASNGKIQVKTYNPTPDSDNEESAQLDGISPRQFIGSYGYLGLAVVRADLKETLPALDPFSENTLEYDLTSAIVRVAFPEKAKIGLISSWPVAGGGGDPMQGPRQGNPPWAFYQQLQLQYEVVILTPGLKELPSDLKTIILVHPKQLSDDTLYALDQYLLHGGKLVAFLDPLSAFDMQSNPMGGMSMPEASSLGRLPGAWGVKFEGGKYVADLHYGISQGQRSDPGALLLDQTAVNADEIISNSLRQLLFFYAGAFQLDPVSGIQAKVLIHSSKDARLDETFTVMMGQQNDNKKADDKEYPLAVMLTGKFPTAFPEGQPQAVPESSPDTASPPNPNHLMVSSSEGAVVLVGDADMLHHSIWLESYSDMFTRQPTYRVKFNNNDLLQNAVSQFSGDENLIHIRAKSVTERPFERVKALQLTAERKLSEKVASLEKDLQEAQNKLRELRRSKQGDNQRYVISPDEMAEIEKYQAREVDFKRELKQLRKELRREVDWLSTKLKFANIFLMPLLVILAGIVVAIIRKRG